MYPNCEITVEYKYFLCFGPNLVDLTYVAGDFIFSVDPNCTEYFIDLENAATNGNLDVFSTAFNRHIYDDIRSEMINTFPELHPLPITITFSIASCSKICVKEIKTTGNVWPYRIESIDCGVECCKKTEIFQHETPGDFSSPWIVVSSTWDNADKTCDEYDEPCVTPSIFDTECTGSCADLLGFF